MKGYLSVARTLLGVDRSDRLRGQIIHEYEEVSIIQVLFKACLYWPMASHMRDEGIGEEMWVGSMDCNRKKIIACDALPAISVNG